MEEPDEVILAKIGDRTISYAEFIRRAEYTIRPKYARGSTNIDKKRVINSLMAEKMLAIEAGDTCKLLKNDRFKRYIEGREQQAMREWLYHREGVEKVKLDTAEIREKYKVAGRKYTVQFITIPNEQVAVGVQDMLHDEGMSFEDVWFRIAGNEKIPEREIEWQTPEIESLHNALFDESVKKNQVLGPIRANDEQYLLMKVIKFTNSMAITEKQQNERLKDVTEKITEKKAAKIYGEFVADLMTGKKMEFEKETFLKLVKIVKPLYFKTTDEQKNLFLDKTFKRESEQTDKDSLGIKLDSILGKPLFEYEGKLWTVAEFMEEVQRHPLVYRKKKMSKGEFAAQYRLAIADLLRDRELAKVAYQRGYDKVNVVKRYTGMWRDALTALYQRDNFLKHVINTNTDSLNLLKIINDNLNPYVDSLQSKYSDQIYVNVKKFNEIQLTRIDMFVTQSNVPFPIMVPSFPQITTDHKLDYGQKMDIHNKIK